MNNNHIYFLTSTEYQPTLIPRKSWIIDKLWSEERQDFFLHLQIDPPIIGRKVGIKQDIINEVVIATRHRSTSLYPLEKLPISVYICHIINNEIKQIGKVSAKDLEIIMIGEIYDTLEDAENAISDNKERM
jgi:hypothetical protein